MAEWVTPLISGVSGFSAAFIGAGAILIAKRFDPEYRRYLDEKRQAECEHVPIESRQIDAFCEKCKKTLTKEDLIRLRILNCKHYGSTDLMWEDENTLGYLCTVCSRSFEVPRREME